MIALNFNGILQFSSKSETFGSHQIHDIFCTLLFSAHLYKNLLLILSSKISVCDFSFKFTIFQHRF